MSYDLAVWEGPRPAGDAAAAAEFARRVAEMDRLYEAGEPMTEPTAAIRTFVAAAEERYPEDDVIPMRRSGPCGRSWGTRSVTASSSR